VGEQTNPWRDLRVRVGQVEVKGLKVAGLRSLPARGGGPVGGWARPCARCGEGRAVSPKPPGRGRTCGADGADGSEIRPYLAAAFRSEAGTIHRGKRLVVSRFICTRSAVRTGAELGLGVLRWQRLDRHASLR